MWLTRMSTAMSNPYETPRTQSSATDEFNTVHHDWKWIALFVYAICVFCMLGVIGRTNPSGSTIRGFGHGFIRAPHMLGYWGFMASIPVLSMLPASLVVFPFKRIYRGMPKSDRATLVNFSMLVAGVVVAILNASLYRGD